MTATKTPRGAANSLSSPSGMTASFTAAGCLSTLEVDGVWLLMYPATQLEPGPANLWLRRHAAGGVEWTPLLGPASPSTVAWSALGPRLSGSWRGLSYTVRFRLASRTPAWFWAVTLTNDGSAPAAVDLVLTHDPALAPGSAVRTNEYYVAQYLDLSPVVVAGLGTTLAARQNMPGSCSPWLMVGAPHGDAWASDALQLRATPGGFPALDRPRLLSERLQHEHPTLALQRATAMLPPGGQLTTQFFGVYLSDHPEATGPADARWAWHALAQPEARDGDEPPPTPRASAGENASALTPEPGRAAVATVFAPVRPLAVRDLGDDELTSLGGRARTHLEMDGATVLSFFAEDGGHVVTAAKEQRVLRPHGHILRTGAALLPDSAALTSTVWMRGVFHSHVTRGHVGRWPLLSPRRGYLDLQAGHGLRVFLAGAGRPGRWELLDLPSAFLMHPDHCVWRYAAVDGLVVQLTARAPSHANELGLEVEVLAGPPREMLVALHIPPTEVGGDGPSGVRVLRAASSVGVQVPGQACLRIGWDPALRVTSTTDEPLFDDGEGRDTGWVCLRVSPSRQWSMTLSADEPGPSNGPPAPPVGDAATFWRRLGGAVVVAAPGSSPLHDEVARLQAIIPWYAQNALIHYLSPRGLEQYSGGGWGTRDVCQGPVALLTTLGRTDVLRELLLRVTGAQHERGDWPQAFEFLPPAPHAGQDDSHGDVVFWPLLAIGDYLQATADATLVHEEIPFAGDAGPTAPCRIGEHIRRALDHIDAHRILDTPFSAYGRGDWNDAMQPATLGMGEHLASVWTAVLQVQALRSLSTGLRGCAAAPDQARRAAELAGRTETALQDLLRTRALLPGYLMFRDDGTAEPLVHPDDTVTGMRYGILPWIHAISADLLSPRQAQDHLAALREKLLGPDGARLFDRPARYAGGPMTTFRRAEAASFWGREIGLMYTHAHLRYAEALARVGDGPGLLTALSLAHPVGITDRVPLARRRQSTCYFSSSDGAFPDRYQAAARYHELMAGQVGFEGGWRVYSSGPGLFLRLLVECLLGVRCRGDALELDPVLDPRLDGLRAQVTIDGGERLRLAFRVGRTGAGVRRVSVADRALVSSPLSNRYRAPGVRVSRVGVRELLAGAGDAAELTVETA
ncbi:GH36-type glycosyl hydrolase domain-containing protein [Rugosimonospora africana]|uniref:Cellobiose phosphorylase n=1 Tax=Rugosimonospora africana TaxID=556532 RepID=A0A8J3QZZ5_9ACTN|nr:hypothetical protein [Rugosimonospora africana]GIH20460.1 cellobiose phosphorylase [Rugosimonospora africana]